MLQVRLATRNEATRELLQVTRNSIDLTYPDAPNPIKGDRRFLEMKAAQIWKLDRRSSDVYGVELELPMAMDAPGLLEFRATNGPLPVSS